jgi:molybdate transport system substrate-binding protein
LLLLCIPGASGACIVRIATASNFATTLREVVHQLEVPEGTKIDVISGASGVLFAQIRNGAPFDVFFSADASKPDALEQSDQTVGETWVYATGRLALWVPGGDAQSAVSQRSLPEPVATANPRLAPYGAAAMIWLETTWQGQEPPETVQGTNVAQAFHFVRSGAAPSGIVALSQLLEAGIPAHEYVVLPTADYPVIEQKAARIRHSQSCKHVDSIVDQLRSDTVSALIESRGYGTSMSRQ